jgi:hypothetical protein
MHECHLRKSRMYWISATYRRNCKQPHGGAASLSCARAEMSVLVDDVGAVASAIATSIYVRILGYTIDIDCRRKLYAISCRKIVNGGGLSASKSVTDYKLLQ